jgi:protein TonB
MVSRLPSRQRPEPYLLHQKSGHLAAAGVTILLHAGVMAVLLQFQPVRSAISQAVPIMVSLITPPPAVEKPKEPPKPLPVKPRIKRVEPQPDPPPMITAAREAPPPPAAAEPQPVTPAVTPAPVAAAPAATPPVSVVPPSLDAAYLNNPPPAYPAGARRAGQQGKVMLRVLVNASGSPDRVEIRSSSGFDRLDNAALDAVKHWRFLPARQGDTPVAAWVLVPITFTLES